jgi:1,4-alpha-glucan branching enzyme
MKSRTVTSFSCEAEGADKVFLAGTNDWNPETTSMSKSSSGQWTADLELTPGVYEYRYVVSMATGSMSRDAQITRAVRIAFQMRLARRTKGFK